MGKVLTLHTVNLGLVLSTAYGSLGTARFGPKTILPQKACFKLGETRNLPSIFHLKTLGNEISQVKMYGHASNSKLCVFCPIMPL